MKSLELRLGALDCQVIMPETHVSAAIVLLHGYAMDTQDLAPLAAAMGLSAALYLPRGPIAASPQGYCWWPINEERRSAQLALGPRDLFEEYPARASVRVALKSTIEAVRQIHGLDTPLFLAGFSQGGMLACDTYLHEGLKVSGLVLMSTSRIAIRDWQPHLHRARNLPVLVTHGKYDADLALQAGEQLRDCLADAGAKVAWLQFDGGHEIPVTVWRQFKRLVGDILD